MYYYRKQIRNEKKKTPLTSRDDSLVVVLGKVEGGGRWKATNESRRLVGGLFWPGSRAERCAKPPTSRDYSLVVVFGRVRGQRPEGEGKPPTSHDDSLVVGLGEVEGGGRWKPPTSLNDLLVVFFSCCFPHVSLCNVTSYRYVVTGLSYI